MHSSFILQETLISYNLVKIHRSMSQLRLNEPPDLIQRGLVICREKQNDHSFGVFYGQNPLDFSFPLFLLQVSFLITITHLLRFILKPLRQPKVVAEILGAIILGPSVLSRSKKFKEYMFPGNSDFVIKNLGILGFMYFLFLSGVKMDFMVIKRARKKHWYIAVIGVLVPLGCGTGIAYIESKSWDKELVKFSSIFGFSISSALAAFPVIYPIVRELNLLSSGIGRMALSTAVISDVIGLNAILIFETLKQGEHRPIAMLWYLLSFVTIAVSFIGGARFAMLWIIRTTPEEKPVDQFYVVAILLSVMLCGLISDIFGLTIANGPLWLGLAVPDGPPLGAILVEKSEMIMRNILMPFSFMYVGLIFDVSSMISQWSHVQPLVYMILSSYVAKMVSTLVASRFFNLTIRDSLTLSLLISLKGEVEVLLYVHLMELKIIGRPHFTLMVLLAVSVTAIVTPLISILYDPTRPYLVNKRRNIQHIPSNTQLHFVACIHDEENLSGLMKLLEISNPNANSPLSVHALRLVELAGRSNPVLIDHDNDDKASEQHHLSSIHNALKIFKGVSGDRIKIFCYTTITSRKSMYQDICELALSKKACLVILSGTRNEITKQVFQLVNSNVLVHAPCSVGILVDKSSYQNLVNGVLRSSMHHLVVLFLGGGDAREALTYADRMAENPAISLTVVRFLAYENEGDDEMEKKLDDGLVTQFWVRREGNDRIVYREVVVKNGEETIAAIQAMNKDCYDLWIVGRKNGINPVLLKGLLNWSENNELGVIGEYLASVDFDSNACVLAMQQQILRGQEKASDSMLSCFSFWT